MSYKCFVCQTETNASEKPFESTYAVALHVAGIAGKVPDAHAAWVFRANPNLSDLTPYKGFGGMNQLADLIHDDVVLLA